jgi:hypothetical protein
MFSYKKALETFNTSISKANSQLEKDLFKDTYNSS